MTRLAAMLAVLAGGALADPVEGVWRTQANDEGNFADVRIAPCGGALCGRMVTSYDASGRPIVGPHEGALIVEGMSPSGGGAYGGGTITDPQAGRTYGARMSLAGDALRVSGCLAGGLLCRSQTWQRVR
jgi:uncharacterized protein (DUF2147 family)